MAANSTNNSGVCNSWIEKTKDTFIWNIDDFSARGQETGECLESGIFISSSPWGDPLKWQLRLYPNGIINGAKDYLSIYIRLVDSAPNDVFSKQTYWIRDASGVDKMEQYSKSYSNKNNGMGFHQFIKRSVLLNSSSGLLPNDQLTIVCQVTVYGEEMVETAAAEFQVPECRALEDMGNLFDKSLLTDLVLVASSDGKEFKVHKGIMASRSPVFGAMFQHEMMTESKEGVVKIDDIESAVLEQTLRFIYSGTAPKLAEMAEELLEAADKYQLDRLKVLCERQLANSIANENACKLLALAHRHSAENLKAHAIKFIKIHRKEVVKSDDWKMLIKEKDAELIGQLMI